MGLDENITEYVKSLIWDFQMRTMFIVVHTSTCKDVYFSKSTFSILKFLGDNFMINSDRCDRNIRFNQLHKNLTEL